MCILQIKNCKRPGDAARDGLQCTSRWRHGAGLRAEVVRALGLNTPEQKEGPRLRPFSTFEVEAVNLETK